jgi:hypothetical protein
MRVNRGQEFVIGGYTVGGSPFGALIFGYDEGEPPEGTTADPDESGSAVMAPSVGDDD